MTGKNLRNYFYLSHSIWLCAVKRMYFSHSFCLVTFPDYLYVRVFIGETEISVKGISLRAWYFFLKKLYILCSHFSCFFNRHMDLKLIQITCVQLLFIQLSPMFLPAVVSKTKEMNWTANDQIKSLLCTPLCPVAIEILKMCVLQCHCTFQLHANSAQLMVLCFPVVNHISRPLRKL